MRSIFKISFEELNEDKKPDDQAPPADAPVETPPADAVPAVAEPAPADVVPADAVPAVAEPVAAPAPAADVPTGVDEQTAEEKATEISIEEIQEEIGRQEDLADGLDALKTIATAVETPSVRETALFRVAANMAVAGTDEAAEEFIPSIESNKPIDPKSFDPKIKAIKDKIANLNIELKALEAKKKVK